MGAGWICCSDGMQRVSCRRHPCGLRKALKREGGLLERGAGSCGVDVLTGSHRALLERALAASAA
jgi:hypothetical protein